MIEVELPDGSIAEFPDGTPPEVMQAAAKKRIAETPSPLASAVRGVERGVFFNLNDELKGVVTGLGGLFTDEGYDKAYERGRDKAREIDKRDAETNPWSDFTGQAVGSLGTAALSMGARAVPLVASGVSRVAGPVARAVEPAANALLEYLPKWAATRAPGAAKVVAGGAAGGGMSGFGSGEDGFGNRMGEAGTSAAIGGAAAAGLGTAIRAAGNTAGRIGDIFGYKPDVRADRLLGRALERDDVSLEDVGQHLNKAGDNVPLAVVDVGGASTRALGAAAANTPSKATEIADQFVQSRRFDRPDRLATIGDDAFGGGSGKDIAETTAARQQQRRVEASPKYEAAFDRPAGFTEPMQIILDDPISKAGLARGLEIQRIENTTRRSRGEDAIPTTDPSIQYDDEGVPRLIGVPNMRTLDAVKRGFDAIFEDARNPTTGKVVMTERLRAIDELRKRWVSLLDEGNPDYKEARALWAGPSAQMEATDAGRKLFTTDRDVVADRMRGYSQDEADAFRLGGGRAFSDKASDPAMAGGAARKLFEDRQMRARLEAVLPKETLDQLYAGLQREMDMTTVERAVSPRAGSHTKRLDIGMEEISGAPPRGPWLTAMGQVMEGEGFKAGKSLWREGVARGALGRGAAVSDELGKRMFATEPEARAAVAQALLDRKVQDIAAAQRARRVVGPATVAAGSASDRWRDQSVPTNDLLLR